MKLIIVTLVDVNGQIENVICKTEKQLSTLMINYNKEVYQLIDVEVIKDCVTYYEFIGVKETNKNLELGIKEE